jgi:hypothetical protein
MIKLRQKKLLKTVGGSEIQQKIASFTSAKDERARLWQEGDKII